MLTKKEIILKLEHIDTKLSFAHRASKENLKLTEAWQLVQGLRSTLIQELHAED